MRAGTLHGVGLGPGDPELVTLKAARLIAAADVVAYPTLAGGDSFARAIAAGLIRDKTREIAIDVPMTVARAPAQAAYDAASDRIAERLDAGQDVVCLCEGDPFFYGSFMYVFARLAARYPVEIVPGVSSVSACSARAARPLVARNEVLGVVPAPLPEAALRARLAGADALAIVKVGRHLEKVRRVLADLELTDRAIYVARATLDDELCVPLTDAPETAPYFSTILVTKEGDPWLRPRS